MKLSTRALLPQGPDPEITRPGQGAAAVPDIPDWEAAPLADAVERIGLCQSGLQLCRALITQANCRWSAPSWRLILAKTLERLEELVKAAGLMKTDAGKKAVA